MIRNVSLFLLLYGLLVFSSCGKPEIIIEGTDLLSEKARPAYAKFQKIAKRGNAEDSFIFFTDPHLLGANNQFSDDEKYRLIIAFDVAKELYDTLKLNFCLCGGDWLNFGDTQDKAKEKLLFADQQMKTMFPCYYKIMGNHDSNYQGIVSNENPIRGDLTQYFIDNKYFSETGSSYYSFMSYNTEYFVLDSGLDWNTSINDYREKQLHWLANRMMNSESQHKVIGIHMFYNDVPFITPMGEELIAISSSFNSRSCYSLNNITYDFSMSKGLVHYIITGHCHVDFAETIQGIPVIGTTKFYKETNPFDICIVDYDSGYLDMIRVGEGEDRHIKIFI